MLRRIISIKTHVHRDPFYGEEKGPVSWAYRHRYQLPRWPGESLITAPARKTERWAPPRPPRYGERPEPTSARHLRMLGQTPPPSPDLFCGFRVYRFHLISRRVGAPPRPEARMRRALRLWLRRICACLLAWRAAERRRCRGRPPPPPRAARARPPSANSDAASSGTSFMDSGVESRGGACQLSLRGEHPGPQGLWSIFRPLSTHTGQRGRVSRLTTRETAADPIDLTQAPLLHVFRRQAPVAPKWPWVR